MGTISGGAKDEQAPRVKENGLNPPNGSTEFTSATITFTFDEFVKLNNANENITIVPEDVKIKASLHKKTLTLLLDGTLKPETTYKITLNQAVKDVSEGNDSLMQYVFSTGKYIDSLNYTGFLKDAKTSLPIKNATLGFYEAGDSAIAKKPMYYAKSDADGKVVLTYMKAGKYQVIAFEDSNSDLVLQKNERYGFKSEELDLQSSQTDSTGILMVDADKKAVIRSKRYEGPSWIKLGATKSLENATIFINDTLLETSVLAYSTDSIGFLLPNTRSEKVEIVLKNAFFNDTVLVRLNEKEKSKKPTLSSNLQEGKLHLNETLTLTFSDRIKAVDASKISISQGDSIQVPFELKQTLPNQITLTLLDKKRKEVSLKIKEGGLVFETYEKATIYDVPIVQMQARDYGTLILFTDSLAPNTVLELVQNKKIIRTLPLKNAKRISVENIEAGTYQVQGFIDVNENTTWDTGNLNTRIQAEKRVFFNQEIKVRANWELEITLTP